MNGVFHAYLPTGSVIHRLDARVRLLASVLLVVALTAAFKPLGLLLGLAVSLLGILVGRIPLRYAGRALLTPLPFLLILALFQVFLMRGGQTLWEWNFVHVTSGGLWAAALLLMRFAALVLVLNLASFCLTSAQVIRAVDALLQPLGRLGLPSQDAALVIQVTLNFLPFLNQPAARIVKAQSARGADWDTKGASLLERARQVLPFLVPLNLISLRRAEALALALDARGFRSGSRRTSLVVLRFRATDALALLLVVVVAVAICIL